MIGLKVLIQLFASGITSVLTFLILSLSARLFGPEILGQVAYFSGVLGLIFAFTDLGLSRAHVYFTAIKGGRPEVATFLSLKLPLLLLAVSVALIIAEQKSWPLVFIALLLVEVFSRVADSLLIGFEGREQVWPQNLLRVGMKFLRLVAVIILGSKLAGAFGYSLTFLAESLGLMLGALILGRAWLGQRPSREAVNRYVKYSLPFAVIIPLSYLQDNSLILLMKYFQGTTALGLYTASFGLFGFLKTLTSSLMTFFFPRITRLIRENDWQKIQAHTDMAVKLLIIVLLPILLFFFIISQWLVPLILGQEFYGAVNIFRLYLLGVLILAIFAPYDHVLFASHNQSSMIKISLVTTSLLILLGWWLIPVWGGLGAAAASVGVWLITGSWQLKLLKQKTAIQFLRDWRLTKVEVKYLYGIVYSASQAVIWSNRKKPGQPGA